MLTRLRTLVRRRILNRWDEANNEEGIGLAAKCGFGAVSLLVVRINFCDNCETFKTVFFLFFSVLFPALLPKRAAAALSLSCPPRSPPCETHAPQTHGGHGHNRVEAWRPPPQLPPQALKRTAAALTAACSCWTRTRRVAWTPSPPRTSASPAAPRPGLGPARGLRS